LILSTKALAVFEYPSIVIASPENDLL